MKKFFCVLCLVGIMLLGGINVFSGPFPYPDGPYSAQIILIEEE